MRVCSKAKRTLRIAAAISVLAAAAAPLRAGAVDLADGSAFRFDGASAGDRTGAGVAAIGDVNGDGRGDYAIAAPWASNNGRFLSGSVYVIYGGAFAPVTDLASIDTSGSAIGFRIDGAAARDELGAAIGDVPSDQTSQPKDDDVRAAVAAAGDVNGDGMDDVIVGAWGADNASRTGSGSAYVIFGSSSSAYVDLAVLGARGFRIDGPSSGHFVGATVAGAGDMNGDGLSDVVVSSRYASNNGRNFSGAAYLVSGKASLDTVDLAADPTTWGSRVDGAVSGQQLGWAVAGAGDVNGDGLSDVIVSSRYSSFNGRSFSGSAYVIFGDSSQATLDAAALGSHGFRIDGAAPGDQTGTSVARAGDVNGDGLQDIAVGSKYANPAGRGFAGSAFVVFGKSTSDPIDLAGTSQPWGYRIDGATPGDQIGAAIGAAGDVDSDGVPDLLLGSRRARHNGRGSSGSVFEVRGAATTGKIDLAAGSLSVMDGVAAGDQVGVSAAGAGDFNGDGTADAFAGGMYASNSGRGLSGSAWLVPTVPQTVASSGPAAFVSSTSATFAFSGNASTFDCALDTQTFVACTSPATYTNVSEGPHVFRVRAVIGSSVDETPAEWRWTIDVTAPETSITGIPRAVTGPTATFSFTSSESGSTFGCSIDAGAFTACTSPQTYTYLSDGTHVFDVRATDRAGNVDATPAHWAWSVDAEPPQTTITAGPSGLTTVSTATFSFSSSETGSSFLCALDGPTYHGCSSPISYAALTEGKHTFRVEARDAVGNTDPSPDERRWTVDVQPPSITITRPSPGIWVLDALVRPAPTAVVVGPIRVEAQAIDAQSGVSSVGFSVDGIDVESTRISFDPATGVFSFLYDPAPGSHTLTARATNGSGLPASESVSFVAV